MDTIRARPAAYLLDRFPWSVLHGTIPEAPKISPLDAGAWLLHGGVGNCPLHLPLLAHEAGVVLIDTGCAPDPERLVPPAMRKLGFGPDDLKWVVVTHCDTDHQSGNSAIKSWAPRSVLACGDADRMTVESPAWLMRLRYDFYRDAHAVFYDEPTRLGILAAAGKLQRVDVTFFGGETLRLGRRRDLRVMHLLGHSHGHLGMFNVARNTLFGGDAIQGAVYRDLSGAPAFCPTYLYPFSYLKTIGAIETLAPKRYCGGHWRVMTGDAVRAFCAESRAFVERAEQATRAALAGAGSLTLAELCEIVGPQLGAWPAAVHSELRYALHGHLQEMVQIRTARRSETRPVRYAL